MNEATPRIIGHRGFSGKAPENTLAAFLLALQIGADGIEFDVRFSRDLEVMIIHDEKLDRTTSGKGRVRDHDGRDIQTHDAGSWFGPEFSEQRVPTLGNLVAEVSRFRPHLVLEIKPDPPLPGDTAERILSPIPEKLRENLVILSFDHGLLAPFHRRDEPIRCGALVDRRGDAVAQTIEVGAQLLALRRNLVSQKVVQQAHEAGLEIMVWTVDSERELRRFRQWGVDAIITNYPDRAIRVTRARNGDS